MGVRRETLSIRVMTLVWDRFPGAGSELLAMLALADWCNDEGGSLHPSIARVAMKIRASESQARRILHRLIEDGWLDVAGNAFGGAPGTTRQYRMNIPKLAGSPRVDPPHQTPSMDATPSTDATPSMGARDGSHGCAETGSTHDTRSVSRSIKDPSDKDLVPKKKKTRTRHEYTPEFESMWGTYPNRYGGSSKLDTLKAWNARLAAGFTIEQMQTGVAAYAAHVRAAGKEGTEFVRTAEVFLGVACHFMREWPATPPPTGDATSKQHQPSKTFEALQRLQGVKDGLAASRNSRRDHEAGLLVTGSHPGDGSP